MSSNLKIGYYGLTHLGIIYSIVAAKNGFKVFGFDHDPQLISNIQNLTPSISEPKLLQYLKKYKKNIVYSDQISNLKLCDIVFVSFDTPINKKGEPIYNNLKKNIKKLTMSIEKNTELVILSQVYPGFTEKINWKNNKLFYQVETLIFGEAIKRAEKPDRLIIGSKHQDFFLKSKFYKFLQCFNSKIYDMDIKSAELTKISINLFLISSINTTNLISKYCELIGASWKSIIPSLKSDRRIGKYAYLQPNLSLGGSNLMRDLIIFDKLLNKKNLKSSLISSWKNNNNIQKKWLFKILDKILKNKKLKKISILGLSYKENTSSTNNAVFLELLSHYKNINFFLYDSIIKNGNYSKNSILVPTIQECLKSSNVIIILNKSKEFTNITKSNLLLKLKKKIIIDPYNTMNLNEKNFNVHILGN